ncbi:nucleoside 2-deoxyribosyltransferase [Acetobacter sp. LMG 32666]|uniref:nucleoside 2-deoxyribosyltransferase n=1 Tax=Acetobacter sp. LMG 32666 TaxID=2959295 RepID=UPI0030C84F23
MPDCQTGLRPQQPTTPEHAVYLAGPGVFAQDARAQGALLVAACARMGLRGLYPLDAELDPQAHASPPALARAIAHANMGLIRQSHAVIADLSPFRGPNVDDGTAFEIGYAHALGLPVFGYAHTATPMAAYPERVLACGGNLSTLMLENRATLVDENKMTVEDFGLPVNLMIATVLSDSGTIFSSAQAAIAAAAAHLLGQPPR